MGRGGRARPAAVEVPWRCPVHPFLGGHGRAPDLLLSSSVPRGLPRAVGKERAREGPGCRVQGALGLCRMDILLAFLKSCPAMSWMEVLAEGARGGIRDWCGLLETLWCHPLAASPSSSPCWRWIPCLEQLDAAGDSALGLPPSHVEHRLCPTRSCGW